MKKRCLALMMAALFAFTSIAPSAGNMQVFASEVIDMVESTEETLATETLVDESTEDAIEEVEVESTEETTEEIEVESTEEIEAESTEETTEEATETVIEEVEVEPTEEPEEASELKLPTGFQDLEVYELGIIDETQIFENPVMLMDGEADLHSSVIYNTEWDKYSTNYYYNQLNDYQCQLWDAMDSLCRAYLLDELDATENTYGMYMTQFIASSGIEWDELYALARKFRFSNPQYYFLSTTIWHASDSDGDSYLAFGIYPAFAYGTARALETQDVKEQTDAWIAAVNSCATDEEKVLAFHDLIVNAVDYNYDIYSDDFDEELAYSQSVYSVFCLGETVCAGYSQAMEMLCNGAGIECITVTSDDHQWNKVCVDGAWYNVDATWADQSWGIEYRYFGKSDLFYEEDGNSSHILENMWNGTQPECISDMDISECVSTLVVYDGNGATKGSLEYTSYELGEDITVRDNWFSKNYYIFNNWSTKSNGTGKSYVSGQQINTSTWGRAITLYAQWEPETYTIAYVLNGGTNSDSNLTTYQYPIQTIILNAPVRAGYIFAGWYMDSACTSLPISEIAAGTYGNIVLYAKWSPIQYKISYNGNGNTSGSMSVQSIAYGSGTEFTANTFKKKGYTFIGWNTKADGSGTAYVNKEDASKLTKTNGKTITLYAQWKKTKYTITYDLKSGGKNNSGNPSSYYITTATITLKNPTRTGYTFAGWYSDSAYKNKITEIKKGSTGNKTIYAKWTANKYSIVYNGNGSTSGSMSSQTSRKYGTAYTLATNKFKKTGYTFVGWNTKKDGSGKNYNNMEKIKNLTAKNGGSVTLYAQWEKTKYTITYKLNGGKNSSKNPSKYTITTKTIKLKNPTRKGYTFAGWYSDSKFKNKVTQINKGSTGKKTLYAKWVANKYKIVYDGNGSTSGKMSATTGCKYDKSYTLKANTYKKGNLTFVGWNTKKDGSGTHYSDKEKIKNISSKSGGTVTLYAQWEDIRED